MTTFWVIIGLYLMFVGQPLIGLLIVMGHLWLWSART